MIKLFVVKYFRDLSFDKTVSSLTEEEAILLSFFDESGQIKLPSGGTLCHFIKYRLVEDGINEVMLMLGEKILKLSSDKEVKIDYTPLEALRMISMLTTILITHVKWTRLTLQKLEPPCFYDSYKELAGDSSELINHIEALKKMNVDLIITLQMEVMIRSLIIQIFGFI